MLGHAGRELSLGVLRFLAQDGRDLADAELTDVDQKEKHRITIARALRLPPSHPSVTAWFKSHNDLVACAHYPTDTQRTPTRGEAVAAANALIAMLWSRVGPYFSTRKDIEDLLRLDAPAPQTIAGLPALLARPAIRWDFFRRLDNPSWVRPLLVAGFFKHPPDLAPPDKEGRRRWEGWAEGEYLRRMADKVPEDVRDAIKSMPKSLANPYAWNTAAEAAKAMPAEIAVSLVPIFRKVLAESVPGLVQETLGQLAVKLAEAGYSEALGLARDALRLVEGRPSIGGMIGNNDRKEAALFGLDNYEAEQLIPALGVALERLDAPKALKFFVHRLDEALRVEWNSPDDEPMWDPSKFWCPDLTQAASHHGFKEQFAVTIARLASDQAANSSDDVSRIVKFLREQKWRVYTRICYLVLARAPHVVRETDAVLSDAELIQEEYLPQEYIVLLQNQFDHVSRKTRETIVKNIAEGPGTDDEIRTKFTDEDGPPTAVQIHTYRVSWQRKRLRRFGDDLPSELIDLSARLDADASVPKPTGAELELEDRGSTGGFGWGGGPKSPLTAEEINALSADQLLHFLIEFEPNREGFDSPTPAGLASMVADRIRREPSLGAELARGLPSKSIGQTYARGILQGLVSAATDGKPIPWSEILPAINWVTEQTVTGGTITRARDFEYGDPDWRWAKREAAKLVALAGQKNLAASSDAPALWASAQLLIASDATWADAREEPETMDGALMAALNTIAGDAVHAFIEVALWNYRQTTAADKSSAERPATSTDDSFRSDLFRSGISTILAREGPSAIPGKVRLGQYLPQLLLMDQEWVLSHTGQLFAGSFAPPLTTPVWGGYITTQRFYNNVFNDLKKWYLEAARALPRSYETAARQSEKDPTWSTTRHLVLHCLLSVIRGLTTPSSDEELVAKAFEHSAVDDRSHAYWEMFNGLKGSDQKIPHKIISRLLDFWGWRLEVLANRSQKEQFGEAGALGWLSIIEALPDKRVLPLLARTAEFANGTFPMEHSMWARLDSLASVDGAVTMQIVDRLVRAELAGDYPHFNIAETGRVLARGLKSGDHSTIQRANDIINLLGDHGFGEFGTLL